VKINAAYISPLHDRALQVDTIKDGLMNFSINIIIL